MGKAESIVAGIFSGIVGLAILSVILSNNAQTVNVIGAFSNLMKTLIGTAVSPITGSAPTVSTASFTNINGGNGGTQAASNLIGDIGTASSIGDLFDAASSIFA